jgi:urease accessory protein
VLVAVVGQAPGGLHLPVATGVAGAAAGLDAPSVARLVVHHTLAAPGQAAVKLLGLDPFEVVALTARLEADADEVVDQALVAASGPIEELPAAANPLAEIAAMDHGRWDVRMFAT